MKLDCAFCGEPFTKNSHNQIYCQRECASRAMNRKHRKPVVHPPRQCPNCKELFVPKRSDSKACSDRCYRRISYSYAPKDNTRNCDGCRGVYKPVRSDSRFCSVVCRSRFVAGTPFERECESCGADISDRMANAKFCRPCGDGRSKVHEATKIAKGPYLDCIQCGSRHGPSIFQHCSIACAGRTSRMKQLENLISRVCGSCGNDFFAFDVRRQQCSTACKQWDRKYPGVPRVLSGVCEYCGDCFKSLKAGTRYCSSKCSARMGKMRRRARERNAFVENVSLAKLIERDGPDCQLCDKPLDMSVEWPHPNYPSIDHVIPLSRGGEHSLSNTQMTHLICNVKKGAKLLGAEGSLEVMPL